MSILTVVWSAETGDGPVCSGTAAADGGGDRRGAGGCGPRARGSRCAATTRALAATHAPQAEQGEEPRGG
jgi:hypothetical protein